MRYSAMKYRHKRRTTKMGHLAWVKTPYYTPPIRRRYLCLRNSHWRNIDHLSVGRAALKALLAPRKRPSIWSRLS